jgi:YVTN family beta-propeller protein
MRHNFLLMLAMSSGVAFAQQPITTSIQTVPGMPPVISNTNLYSETAAGKLSPSVTNALPRVYVPNRQSNDVYVIDPETMKVVDKFRVGLNPQHVVPSWDLKTLWVANNAEGTTKGTLTPIDPVTGKPGKSIVVDDPYNMYFTPDGRFAIIVAEARKRLDFRDAQTMQMQGSLPVPDCGGVNHADFSIDGRYAIFTCEFGGRLAKVDMVNRKVIGYLKLSRGGMPQDIRVSPDGKLFYVADMHADGVHVIDGEKFAEAEFIKTGVGTHGLYPSRDGTKLYVANRGSHKVYGHARARRAACRWSTSLLVRSKRRGRFRVAAVPTWATSAPTAKRCGYRGDSMMSSTQSTPEPAPSRKFQWARSRTALPCGRSQAAIRWGIPAIFARQLRQCARRRARRNSSSVPTASKLIPAQSTINRNNSAGDVACAR